MTNRIQPPCGVVLVEDNLMFAMMIEPTLKRLGYQARTLPGGPTTAADLAAAPPAVVFVNLASSRVDGPALVREIRMRPELSELPVVGYAGHVEREYFQAGRDAGATLVVPNSAMRKALPQILEKLNARLSNRDSTDWPEDED
ncbi:MAG: response regulator [Actinomycetota bacterium]